ncbi:MAG: FAD-dependent oxidoreductase [Candidatus Cloacimonetes bacterium]|nr:FAD-dependent oxidoreductase [Candidatus Cloacimonadota bacterium]
MVNITINDKKVEIEEGTTILQAAEELGIKIPTLCYHKALPAYGACRLCLVEISQNGGTPSIQASCTYPVQEGLIVKTDTEQVIKTRKIMVELLLARCPDSEVVKNLAKEMGVGKPRIEPKNEDCLLCGLCVRMCTTRMGKGAISFAHRGNKRVVQPAFDVQSDVCQTCGACYSVCPTKTGISFEEITDNKPIPILSEFDEGLVERSAIYIPYAQAIPNYANIDKDHCVHIQTGECEVCKEFCKADAINFDQQEEKIDLNVGAVIVATGAKKFDPSSKHEYGYKKYKNVLTSIQFERILSASGPFAGHIQRPADGKLPRRIAWIQCVGSRDEHENKKYCSSVCCMYSIKEAVIAKEHVKQIEPTIFFMDIRAYGKDFDKYYERAKETGVRFIRARVGKVEEIKESGNLLVHYVQQNGKIIVEEFELVVLSVGFQPPEDIVGLSDKLDVRLNQNNFIESRGFSPIETTRAGIFISGPAVSPKDIPETVMQSSGAVAEAAELLADVRGTEIIEKIYPPERDVIGQKPRIGVFVCYCGINIGSVVDVPAVVEYAKTLPNVIYTESNLFTCSQDTQQTIKEKIEEHNLNRVVVASCSPTTHEPLFQETLREAGLNPYLFEMANIRNQCSWVHKDEPVKATEKAKILVKIAVGKARLLEPLQTVTLDVTQKGLVIGGGFAGMISALSIAEQGFEVALIEREKNLGGNLRKLYYTPEGNDIQEYLKNLIKQIESNPHIKVYKNSNIKEIQGYIGNYNTIIQPNDSDPSSKEEEEYEHGIIVIATGANESKPDEYLYEENENVITQLELEKYLVTQKEKYKKLKNIVMIQCVGSRDDEHPYCSRVCCTQAIKNAIRLKELNPKMNIFILYRDIRTYGFLEMYYQQARDKGVIFIRYEEDEKPVVSQVEKKKNLIVEIKDQITGYKLVIEPDQIVLAPAMIPQKDAYDLSQMLKIPLNEDNFFMEAHVKLRPVDFAVEGIFLAGLAHSPKGMDETISQAKAAAERACTIISSDKYTAEANIATVDEEVCAGCGICVSVCPYNASELIFKNGRRICQINTALCKGCGSCACVCPSGAMQQYGFKETQTLEMVYEAL